MKLTIFFILLLDFWGIFLTDAHRILALLPINSKSHFAMFEQIVINLAKRGHHVDVVSHFPRKKPIPNYHDFISLAGTAPNFSNNVTMKDVARTNDGTFLKYMAEYLGNDLCKVLEHPKIEELIRNPFPDEPYDLVISQVYTAHCYVALGHHLKVPVVGYSTAVLYPWMNDLFGNPDNSAYIPNTLQGFVRLSSFWQRLQNTVFTISDKFWYNYYTSPQDAIVRKYFGPDAPGIRDLERSMALLLVNSHYSLNGVKPLTPAVVEVGGVHINDDVPDISPELKEWLDESTEGLVYFTFGSMVKIETLAEEVLLSMYASFAKIAPIRVLVKIVEKDQLPPGLPENVLTMPWISQYKVLKHKNVKAFITHGGLMGTQEAVVCGVPLIGIPLFADQGLNINVYVEKKIAVLLNYKNITVESLDAALNAVLKDPAYREAAKKLSAQFLDRPMSAIDTSIFWIEYVIRNGPNALRSPVLDLTWWQVALIDVYGFLFSIVILAAYILKILTAKIKIFSSANSDTIISKTKKTS